MVMRKTAFALFLPPAATAVLFSLILFCLFTTIGYSQQAATATLTGRIVDPNGAAMAGAVVTASRKGTGTSRDATTTGEGLYVISNLPADEYEVKVQSKGFTNKVFPSLRLQVGQTSALDVQLEVNVKETVIIDDRYNFELVNASTSVVD